MNSLSIMNDFFPFEMKLIALTASTINIKSLHSSFDMIFNDYHVPTINLISTISIDEGSIF
jgi:hypothetical protein